ncbi:Ubiquitin-conjugating enzyme/RWD-like protein [Pseudocohnilembus persalinus]|uniref:Ubiquitin-conjugating enzyme/RWD-like protein n=1 Tax=Pseudocohnilembus persalinus TaxID=266149 RepID=A0A0V0QCF9_PSEPJ|nr:Ubiquitin-conjugating enzyme/RWD-like protein [Pseudocohnilembus persalinus]|eukprot:KRW99913.1 Ubiquitin-conjugating enzyme/RWD-like protein [Pseudocohnilembus persalinus]
MANSVKRLQNELVQCQKIEDVEVTQDPNNQMIWNLLLNGPADTPYAGGKFKVVIEFPAQYPFKFPSFKFVTQMFHPNIDERGELCKEMIGESDWVPTKKVSSVIAILKGFFNTVNENAVNQQAWDLYNKDKQKYEQTVKEYTQKYAK